MEVTRSFSDFIRDNTANPTANEKGVNGWKLKTRGIGTLSLGHLGHFIMGKLLNRHNLVILIWPTG